MLGRADTHIHTKYSGFAKLGPLTFPESASDPYDVVKHARRLGDDVICITDHDTMTGAFKALEASREYDDIDVVMGEEITSSDGEILGLWLNEEIPPGMSAAETIDAIRSQGGLVVAPHPFSLHIHSLQEMIFELDIDAIETQNAGHIDSWTNNHARCIAEMYSGRWATLGASDAHSLPTMGHAWTEYRGSGEEDLRKAILKHECYARGYSVPMDKAIDWSIGVIMQADMQIIRSILGLIRSHDTDDPVERKIMATPFSKKFVNLIGSFFFLLPPVPYLATIASQHWFARRSKEKILSISSAPSSPSVDLKPLEITVNEDLVREYKH